MSINEEALSLDPLEKIKLIDQLLLSLDIPNKELDALWAKEAQRRIESYKNGKSKAHDVTEVLSKYKK